MKKLALLSAVLLLFSACKKDNPSNDGNNGTGNGTTPINNGPEPGLLIVHPKDTFDRNDNIPVEVQFADDTGLDSAVIILGTQTTGDSGYYYTKRALSGTSGKIKFNHKLPLGFKKLGAHYIDVTVSDIDGNTAQHSEPFYVLTDDPFEPSIDILNTYGKLTTSPDTLFEVYFQVSDNVQLQSLDVSLIDKDGQAFAQESFSVSDTLVRKLVPFPGNSSYVVGTEFRAKLVATDVAGNQNFALSATRFIQ